MLNEAPHLAIFGNQARYETRRVGSTSVVLIPSFAESGLLVLFNPVTHAVSKVTFDVQQPKKQ